MSTRRTTPPAALAVSLQSAKDSLRIMAGDTALDSLITLAIKAITLEAEHQLGRSLVTQGWRLTLDAFQQALRLDFAPVSGVTSIKYYDAANALQTLHPDDYTVDTASEPGYVVPAPGKAWPATYSRVNAVEVEYLAGYGASEDDVPANIQSYILVRLAEQFDSTGREFKETPQSRFAERLLDVSRTYA